MSREYSVTINLSGIFIIIMIILCIGEPDLLDAIIEYVQSLSR